MFHVGQKVVCVDASDWSGFSPLTKGVVYTVKELTSWVNEPAVHLVEIGAAANVPYFAYRFRPIDERKTDISIFKAMLTPKKVRVEA